VIGEIYGRRNATTAGKSKLKHFYLPGTAMNGSSNSEAFAGIGTKSSCGESVIDGGVRSV